MFKASLKILLLVILAPVSFSAAMAAAMWASPLRGFAYFFVAIFIILYAFMYFIVVLIFRFRKKDRLAALLTWIGIFVFLSAAALIPDKAGQHDVQPPENKRSWSLSTGSTISYIQIEGNPTTRKGSTPVLFLHGGPGVPDLTGDSRYFGQLAEEGFDVYAYAQLGSGLSSREDPGNYSVERDALDLEAIRQQLGKEKFILIGHSYGAEIIAQYMSEYGKHVAKAVFLSPGAINPNDRSDTALTGRLTPHQKWKLYSKLLHPRSLFVYALLQFQPSVARTFASDSEMDHRFDKVYAATVPALHCEDHTGGRPLSGLGFYANQTPQSIFEREESDLRGLLMERKLTMPILIVKGGCDYLSWESAMDYRRAFTNNILVYLPHAGHNVYQDQPKVVMDDLRAFLNGETQLISEYSSWNKPRGYQEHG